MPNRPGPRTKRPRGRPPLPPEDVKSISIRIRFKADEYRQVLAAARKAGIPIAAYVRNRVLKGLSTGDDR